MNLPDIKSFIGTRWKLPKNNNDPFIFMGAESLVGDEAPFDCHLIEGTQCRWIETECVAIPCMEGMIVDICHHHPGYSQPMTSCIMLFGDRPVSVLLRWVFSCMRQQDCEIKNDND